MINRDLSSPCFIYRYDVELYQRIEQLIGKKLPLYPTVEEEVMLLMERVTEAQRYAKMVRIPPHLTPYIQVCLWHVYAVEKIDSMLPRCCSVIKHRWRQNLEGIKRWNTRRSQGLYLIERFSFAFQWNVSGKSDHVTTIFPSFFHVCWLRFAVSTRE